MQTTSQLANVSARITAEVLLGKIRFSHGGEPSYLFPLREVFMRFEKSVGRDSLESALPEIRDMMHATADALADAVTGVKSKETQERLRGLRFPNRAIVEIVANRMTGKTSPDRRWNDSLYRIRKGLDQVVALSVSGLTMEELRAGYDEFLHAVVDHLCDNWRAIVD